MRQQGGLGGERHVHGQIGGQGQALLADQGASTVGEQQGRLTAGVALGQGGLLLHLRKES